MQTIRVIFTKHSWNPVSWAIRWMLSMSRVRIAHSSRSMVVDSAHAIEAVCSMRRVPHTLALAGAAQAAVWVL